MKTITLGIFGGGTVGGGVVEILSQQKAVFEAQGICIEIKKLCVRDTGKKRDFQLPEETIVVSDFSKILEDEEIDLVVECIGGTTKAKDIVFESIKKGKSVVTANKALISAYLSELEALLAQYPKAGFGFEASVGGGIPIIHTLARDLVGDPIQKISGILNGTTNFILSKMEKEGADYAKTLKEAQDLGYAESDPTADIEGYDARSKIAILAKVAFGVVVEESSIFMKGISQITKEDFAYADLLGGTIKLLVVAEKKGNSFSIYVSPMIVPYSHNLAPIGGATNAVLIGSKYLSETVLVGQGAGRFPTANAIVSDILLIAHGVDVAAFSKKESLVKDDNIEGKVYIRMRIKDGLGIVRRVAECCEKAGVSIDSVQQLPIENPNDVPFVVTTDKTTLSAIEKVCEEVGRETFCLEKPFFMPIL